MSHDENPWKKSVTDEVSPEHAGKVLEAMRPLLKQNAELFAREGKSVKTGFRWQLLALPGLAVVVLVVLGTLNYAVQGLQHTPVASAPMSMEMEIAMEYAMLKDLEAIENFEMLQNLGEPETWPQKKQRKAPSS
jgi:hypothetical protein